MYGPPQTFFPGGTEVAPPPPQAMNQMQMNPFFFPNPNPFMNPSFMPHLNNPFLQNPNNFPQFPQQFTNSNFPIPNPNPNNFETPPPNTHNYSNNNNNNHTDPSNSRQQQSESHHETIRKLDDSVISARRDFLASNENVSSWSVSQRVLLMVKAESWECLGIQMHQVPSLNRLLIMEGKVNDFIHCFVAARNITSLHELEASICESEGIERFEELELGPLLRHPLVVHYFSLTSGVTQVCKISTEDIFSYLCEYLDTYKNILFQFKAFLNFILKKQSLSTREMLGVRIQNLGLYIRRIKQLQQSEDAEIQKCLEKIEKSRTQALTSRKECISSTAQRQLQDHFTSVPNVKSDGGALGMEKAKRKRKYEKISSTTSSPRKVSKREKVDTDLEHKDSDSKSINGDCHSKKSSKKESSQGKNADEKIDRDIKHKDLDSKRINGDSHLKKSSKKKEPSRGKNADEKIDTDIKHEDLDSKGINGDSHSKESSKKESSRGKNADEKVHKDIEHKDLDSEGINGISHSKKLSKKKAAAGGKNADEKVDREIEHKDLDSKSINGDSRSKKLSKKKSSRRKNADEKIDRDIEHKELDSKGINVDSHSKKSSKKKEESQGKNAGTKTDSDLKHEDLESKSIDGDSHSKKSSKKKEKSRGKNADEIIDTDLKNEDLDSKGINGDSHSKKSSKKKEKSRGKNADEIIDTDLKQEDSDSKGINDDSHSKKSSKKKEKSQAKDVDEKNDRDIKHKDLDSKGINGNSHSKKASKKKASHGENADEARGGKFPADIGFKIPATLDDALSILELWIKSDSPFKASISQMSNFYAFLSKEIPLSKKKNLKKLRSCPFIFVPYSCICSHEDALIPGELLSPHEVYWHDGLGAMDHQIKSVYPERVTEPSGCPLGKMLHNLYPNLHDFFVHECGVDETPTLRGYLEILLELSAIYSPRQAAKTVYEVFLRWSNALKFDLLSFEDVDYLKESLQKEETTVLPTRKDKWASLHASFGLICWGNDDNLVAEFKSHEGVDFLCFDGDENQMLRVSDIMQKLGIPSLSQIVTREAIYYGPIDCDYMFSLLDWILPYAQRYIFNAHPEKYLQLKQSNFEDIRHLKIAVVEKLFYRNAIKRYDITSKKRYICNCLLQGSILYCTRESDPHTVFLEFSRLYYNGTPDLQFANFLHMIAIMAESGVSEEKLEYFIVDSQKVPKLPAEESSFWSLQPDSTSIKNNNTSVETNKKFGQKSPSFFKKKTPVLFDWDSPFATKKPITEVNTEEEKLIQTGVINYPMPTELITEDDDQMVTLLEESKSIVPRNLLTFSKDECDGKNNHQSKDTSQQIITGRLGEFIAFKYLVEKIGEESVTWVNEHNETFLPYDIVTGDESTREYIEVKATTMTGKYWFLISMREWQFAIEKGESFSIAHVVLSENNMARVTIYRNPAKLCQLGNLKMALLVPK